MKPSNDREAITLIMDGLREAGVKPTDTWDGYEQEKATTTEQVVAIATNLDEVVVNVNLPGGGESHLYFVLGNSPEEVVADYGLSLDPYLSPIVDLWWVR